MFVEVRGGKLAGGLFACLVLKTHKALSLKPQTRPSFDQNDQAKPINLSNVK